MTDATKVERAGTWAKLRDRKVGQWGVVYAAGAWGFLQGLAYVTDTFHWPEQIRQLATLALLIGLPIVLVLAWYHGDRGEQRITTSEFAILTLLLLLGGGVLWYYQRTMETEVVAAQPPPPAVAPVATDRSIAVLPFVNMSPDKDQEYFADGISEELLNLLAQVPELRVIARTSSFSFKGKDVDVSEIAGRLNVAHVLEGSVRKSGGTLRITAKLVRASDSSHLWSQTYDRTLDDIFAIQDEIAEDVVKELKVALLGGTPTARRTNPEAYAMFLQARQLAREGTADAYKRSDALYQRALTVDPSYAPAWDGLSVNYSSEPSLGMRSNAEGLHLAREATEKALLADPDYAPAHAGRGFYEMVQGDLVGAVPHFERALKTAPADLDVLRDAASLLKSLGRPKEAIRIEEYWVSRDPVNGWAFQSLGQSYVFAGRFDEAITQYQTALILNRDRHQAHYAIGVALLLKGLPAEALVEMQQEPIEIWRLIGLAMTYHALGRSKDSDVALSAVVEKYAKDAPYNVAYVYAFRGEADAAFKWLERAVRYGDPGLAYVPLDHLLANIHADARWGPFIRTIGKSPEQLAAINFEVTLPK